MKIILKRKSGGQARSAGASTGSVHGSAQSSGQARSASSGQARSASSGQALPYMVIMMVALIICWAMMINMAKLLKDRTMMQNAADNAAISMAVNQARTMNILNRFDLIIESILYDGIPYPLGLGFGAIHPVGNICGASAGPFWCCPMSPILPQIIADDVSQVAFYPDLMIGCFYGCHFGFMTGVIHSSAVAEVMKDITEFLADSQTAVARLGPMYSWIVAREIGKRQEIGANDNKTGADIIIPLNTCALGLLPNKQTIDFCGTDQVFVSIPAVWPWPGLHAHIAFTESVGTVDKTWYFADRNKFFKKKITVIAVKNSDSGSNKGYPLFGDWIGITWPSMQTVASACYYNKSGPGNVLYTNPSSGDVHETHVRDSFYESRDHGGKWQAHLVPVNQFAIMH